MMARGETYEEFVEKFKPKKTTDDCYTPPAVYDAVRDWACAKFELDPAKIVRPFYPGGDYQNFDYPDGCVVLDNPPFSILAEIKTFYLEHKIKFFLFAPTLTLFSYVRACELTHIVTDLRITYENGAKVNTSFVTNLPSPDLILTAPELRQAINIANGIKPNPQMENRTVYPKNIINVGAITRIKKIPTAIPKSGAVFVRGLDAQGRNCEIYGRGFLVCDRSADIVQAAQTAAARDVTVWQLSQREREIVEILNLQSGKGIKNTPTGG